MEPSSQRNRALTPVVFDGLKVGVSPNFYTNSRLLVTLTENTTPLGYLLSKEMEFSKGRFHWPATGWPGDQYWGFVDLGGNLVVPPVYYDAHAFSEGVAAVNACPPRSPRWGMIDIDGRVVVPFEYDWLGVMSEGRVAFARDGKFGYMDREGQVLIPPKFAVAGAFRDGRARVRRSPIRNAAGDGPFTSMYLINDKGRIVGREETGYGDIDHFEALLDRDALDFRDEDTRLWGYRSSQSGDILISPRFTSTRAFSEGLAPVKTPVEDNACEYIDKRGTVVFAVPHENCYPLRQGRALAWSYKADPDNSGYSTLRWAVYDRTGKVVFDHIEGYDDALPERMTGICKDDGTPRNPATSPTGTPH